MIDLNTLNNIVNFENLYFLFRVFLVVGLIGEGFLTFVILRQIGTSMKLGNLVIQKLLEVFGYINILVVLILILILLFA